MAVYWGVHSALNANANPRVLMLGDSWFWYPIDNLAVELGAALTATDFLVIGKTGSEAQQWSDKYRQDIDTAFKLYGDAVSVLMLSGGGNDIAGSADFLKVIADNCSKATTVADCYRVAQPDEIISRIIGAYRALIIKFRARNPAATVLTHNYDYAWPTGKGLLGPADWLKVPMDLGRVPKALRQPLFKDLIDRLQLAQQALGAEPGIGPLVALKSAGTMPAGPGNIDPWWANELHPTPKGFKLLVGKCFAPALKPLLGA